jgi:threonylcarbamoyladenosine tRNA methylthiotransferase MtaB
MILGMTAPEQVCQSQAVRIVTLGCKVNQADSEALAAELARRGFRIAGRGEPAAACIVNTCTVTRVADAKARKLIHRLVRDHPQAAVIVTGCYVARAAQELASIAGVIAVVPNGRKGEAADVVERTLAGRQFRLECLPGPTASIEMPALKSAGPRPTRPGSVRAFVAAQDGCDHGCAYCIVPAVRGAMRSRPIAEVIGAIENLAAAGACEVVICGIRLGAYGGELDGRGLARLLRAARGVSAPRLRLSSVEPWEVGPELIAEMAGHPRLCPHLHLPLQSGDDGVLRAMGRPYTGDDYRALVERLRRAIPDVAITTDLMVGFPGESEAAFARTASAVEEIGVARAHVFRYSRRPGTRAATMPQQVAEGDKTARARRLSRAAQEAARRFAQRFVGRVAPVLFERCQGGVCAGLSDAYLPVEAPGDASLVGVVAGVEIVRVEGNVLVGRVAAGGATVAARRG